MLMGNNRELSVELRIPGLKPGELPGEFDELNEFLKREHPSIQTHPVAEKDSSLGVGKTLEILFTSETMEALAKGLSNFINKKKYKVDLKISPLGFISVTVDHPDAAAILKIIMEHLKKGGHLP